MSKVRYWWSDDGVSEVCEMSNVITKEMERCYHCDQPIAAHKRAVQLQATDGARYLLHPECAALSTDLL